MLTPAGSSSSQYIQPDYLSPLPTTMDSKRSPLALLAQTCSQIGADPLPPAPKSSSSADKVKKEPTAVEASGKTSRSPPAAVAKNQPREEKIHSDEASSTKPGFKSPVATSSHSASKTTLTHSTTSMLSSSTSTSTAATDAMKLMESQRTAMEQMQSLPKDVPLGTYRPPVHASVYSAMSSPYPGLDANAVAALGLGAFRHPYPHLGAMAGYPPVSLGLGLPGYPPSLNYSRLPKSVVDPISAVCRDPYCGIGCSSSGLPNSAAPIPSATPSTGGYPADCTQCDHPKVTAATPPSSSSSTASSFSPTGSATNNTPKPYVCNWIAGDNYCGKRFGSSDELLQHLRSHTSLSVPVSSSSSSATSATATSESSVGGVSPSSYTSAMLNPALHPHSHLFAAQAASSAAVLHRGGYPTPPLSPLSMARYHPYSKAPAPPAPASNALLSMSQNPLAALGVGSLGNLGAMGVHNPLSLSPYAAAAAAAAAGHPGLGAYYSHPAYSLYSQRLGAGVLP